MYWNDERNHLTDLYKTHKTPNIFIDTMWKQYIPSQGRIRWGF